MEKVFSHLLQNYMHRIRKGGSMLKVLGTAIVALTILLFANTVMYQRQFEIQNHIFIESTLDEAYNYESDAWIMINKIKTYAKNQDEIERCDSALESIGKSKDTIMRAKQAVRR